MGTYLDDQGNFTDVPLPEGTNLTETFKPRPEGHEYDDSHELESRVIMLGMQELERWDSDSGITEGAPIDVTASDIPFVPDREALTSAIAEAETATTVAKLRSAVLSGLRSLVAGSSS